MNETPSPNDPILSLSDRIKIVGKDAALHDEACAALGDFFDWAKQVNTSDEAALVFLYQHRHKQRPHQSTLEHLVYFHTLYTRLSNKCFDVALKNAREQGVKLPTELVRQVVEIMSPGALARAAEGRETSKAKVNE